MSISCKFFHEDPKSPAGGLCCYCYLCPHLYNDEIPCSCKKTVREYEERKKQFDPPTPLEIRESIDRRTTRRHDSGYVKKR